MFEVSILFDYDVDECSCFKGLSPFRRRVERERQFGELLEDLFALSRFGDPNGAYAYCFCEPN